MNHVVRPIFKSILVASAMFAFAQCVHAKEVPIQYQIFAIRHHDQILSGSSKPLAYSSNLMAKLNAVNSKINASIKPKNDAGDVWSLGPKEGDCEDYALTKRAALIKSGLNSGSLRMAITRTYGQYHAVLIVKTSNGDFVLDNLKKNARPIGEYIIISQATENPMVWR